jgi:uncharacterized protein HemY
MRTMARLRLRMDMREHAAAESLLLEALAHAAGRQAAAPLESAEIQTLLGDCLLRQGQFARAETALRAYLVTREQKDAAEVAFSAPAACGRDFNRRDVFR